MEAQPGFGEVGVSAEVLERRAESRNPAEHDGRCYTRLSVPEAIAQAKRSHSLLVVLLKGEGSHSLLADEKLHFLLQGKPFKYTALRLHDDLSNKDPRAFFTAKAFREYYPASMLPVLHVLDPSCGKTLSKLEGPLVAAQVEQLVADLRLKAEKKAQPKAPVSSVTSTSSATSQEAARQHAVPQASPGSSAQPQPSGCSLEDSAKEWDPSMVRTRLPADPEKDVSCSAHQSDDDSARDRLPADPEKDAPRSAPQSHDSASTPEATLALAALAADLPKTTASEDAANTPETSSRASTAEVVPSTGCGSVAASQEPGVPEDVPSVSSGRVLVSQKASGPEILPLSAPLSQPGTLSPNPQDRGPASEARPSSSSENLHEPTALQPGLSEVPAPASMGTDSSQTASQPDLSAIRTAASIGTDTSQTASRPHLSAIPAAASASSSQTASQPDLFAIPAAASIGTDSSQRASQLDSSAGPGAGGKGLRTDKKPPTVGLDQISPSRRKPKPEEVGKVTFQALKEQLVNLQFRITDGSIMRAEFSANTRLADVAAHVSEHRTDGSAPYTLAVPFPRRTLGVDDMGKTLLELDLVPRSTLVLLPDASRSAHSSGYSRTGGIERMWSRVCAFLLALFLALGSFLGHLNPLRNAPQPEAAEPGPQQRRQQSDLPPPTATSYQGGSLTPSSVRQRQVRKNGEESNDSDSA